MKAGIFSVLFKSVQVMPYPAGSNSGLPECWGTMPPLPRCFPSVFLALIFCKVHMQERRGRDLPCRGTKAPSIRSVPVTLCFHCLAGPPTLCLFDLDICTGQEMVVSRQRKTKPAHVVGGWRRARLQPRHRQLHCSL